MFDPERLEQDIQQMPMDRCMAEMRNLTSVVKKNPKNWEARYVLALLYLRYESRGEALTQLKKAQKLNPRSETILKTLCEVLYLDTKNYKNALGYLKKWSMIRKDLAILWIYIAECQNALGKPEDALEALRKAEKIEKDHPKIRLARADIFAKTGDEASAQKDYELAFEETGSAESASGLISLPNYDADVEVLSRIRSVILEQREDSKPLNALFSMLGSAFEKQKAYEEAFDCFKRANDERIPFLNREEQLAPFKNIRETFTREYMLTHAGQGHDSDQPIFIVGMPRSGTTLTESILAAHPKIVDNGELSFFYSLLNKNGAKQVRSDFLKDRLSGLKGFFDEVPPGWLKDLGKSYFNTSGFRKGDKRFQVDKLPHNFLSVGLIHLVFPNAKIIHCRRHPYDGALSCYKAAFSEFHDYATDVSFLGSYYRNYWDLMEYWRELLPGKMFEICYEHVVSETESVARSMIDHLGLEWDDRCLDHTRSKKSVRTASQWQVRQPIYTSSVAKWRNYETHLQPMIKAMGPIAEAYETELAALQSE